MSARWASILPPKIRVGTLAIPLDTVEAVDLTPANFETHKLQIVAVEQERYGAAVLERIDNYLRSGIGFACLQTALRSPAEPAPEPGKMPTS